MRGDLVYEKLGEIDEDLIADALPIAAVTPPLYQLGSNQPMRPPRGPRVRKVVLICACILLAGLMLVGGGLALSRTVEFPSETETAETQSDQGNELAYQGIVTIGGFGPLTDSDDLESIGNEIKARFTAATPMEDECLCWRDLPIQIGDTTLTYNRDHGCFRNGDTGKVYRLQEQDREYVNELLHDMWTPAYILSFVYQYDTLRHGDDFVFSVDWGDIGSIFKINKVYLRYEGDDTEYVTPGFFTVEDQTTYRIRIKDDAPYGKYTLVAQVFSPYTGRNMEMEILSEIGAVEIVPNETEPAYEFDLDLSEQIIAQGDTLTAYASLTNLGDTIHRFGMNTVLHPKAELRGHYHGETISFELTDDWIIEDGHQVRTLMSGQKGETAMYVLQITEDIPMGTYDLVLSFEGKEQIWEGSVTVTEDQVYPIKMLPGESYRFQFRAGNTDSEYYLELFEYLIPMEIQDGYAVVTIPEDAEGGYYSLWERYNGEDTLIMYEFVYVPERR